jgi:hypothetical protein
MKQKKTVVAYSNTLSPHGGSRFCSNVGSYLTKYTVSHPRKLLRLVLEIVHAPFYQTFQKPIVYSFK